MQLFSIDCGTLQVDGGAMFGSAPKTVWSRYYSADRNNRVELSMRALLVVTGNRVVLINNGCGEKLDDDMRKLYGVQNRNCLAESLLRVGYSFADVTDVILTHLHFDHCGGSTFRNNMGEILPTFSNARYWVSKPQWSSFNDSSLWERESFIDADMRAVFASNQLFFIENIKDEFPDISFSQYHGHTVGQVIPTLLYGQKQVVYVSDLIPLAAHIFTRSVSAYDGLATLSIEEQSQFLTQAVESHYTLFFEHDKDVVCCSVANGEKGFEVAEVNVLIQ